MPASDDDQPVLPSPLTLASDAWTTILGSTATVVDETVAATDVFTRSACPCATCTSMNDAVDTWHDADASTLPPLLQCVVRAIDGTVPAAVARERDKRFVHCPDQPDPPPG